MAIHGSRLLVGPPEINIIMGPVEIVVLGVIMWTVAVACYLIHRADRRKRIADEYKDDIE
jgi:hypothetical protein